MLETYRSSVRLTVAETLRLPEVVAGDPHLIAGHTGVDREVRWAHVAAGVNIAELLDGGELILTTGAGWPSAPSALTELATGLVTAGATGPAAVFFELSERFSEAPAPLITACEMHGIPLVLLHREVRFVHITQRVHQRILATQHEALEARAAVHSMLTELGLNRSPVDYVVERLAETLGCPVILEDPGFRVVACAGLGSDPAASLHPWTQPGGTLLQGAGWERVPVEARGQRWGTLTALPGPEHLAGRRTVLELGAFALALGRLADADGDQWMQLSSKRLIETMLDGRYRNNAELTAQLTAAGLPLSGRVLIAAALRGDEGFGGHDSLLHATLETALRRAVAPDGNVLVHTDASGSTLLALLSFAPDDARATDVGQLGAPVIAQRLAHELDMLVPATTPAQWRAHLVLGAPGRRLRNLVAALEQVRAVGRVPSTDEVGRVLVHAAARQPLAHLVRSLGSAPELQEFATDTLAPLVAHDAASGLGHSHDLIRVVRAYTQHPTNRSLAAQQARLSRSVFYQRLALVEELLGVDLADGQVIAALSVALLAHTDD